MRIDILTLFTDMFQPLKQSILGRAVNDGKIEIVLTDIRDYTADKHKRCDDYTFGGGAGMLMMAQPICDAIEAIDPLHKAHRIYMSPKGRTFNQKMAVEFSNYDRLLLLCGHYEGVDQRAIELCIDEEVSIGDFVLTGGELAAMVITDCVSRYVEGVINGESLQSESFTDEVLEYPQYTRPQVYKGLSVPDVLLSGNHAEIAKWRKEKSLEVTKKLRPDLLKNKDK